MRANIISLLIISFLLQSCATAPSATKQGPRTIILNGTTFSEDELGRITSWRCVDYIRGNQTLVEVGFFSKPDYLGVGFILYGEPTVYRREGINHRWDWRADDYDYAFIIKPDGTGLYIDFSVTENEVEKPDERYKCYQR
jgi:hypothetical protein